MSLLFDEERIEDFDLLGQVGEGAFGRVLRVRKRGEARDYALKVVAIPTAASGDVEAAAAAAATEKTATNEIGILTAVDEHPFIVRMFHCFIASERRGAASAAASAATSAATTVECSHCLLLEYLPGGNFRELAERQASTAMTARRCGGGGGGMPERAAAFFFGELVCALQYLHECSIVFRDLKPENMMLDAAGHLKLVDFGLARAGVDEVGGSSCAAGGGARSFCGTAAYLPPEMLEGVEHGTAVDWWSAGVVLFELVVGRVPFAAEGGQQQGGGGGGGGEAGGEAAAAAAATAALFARVCSGSIEFPGHMSRHCRALCAALLVRRPEDRLGSGPLGTMELRRHPFFSAHGIDDWARLEARQLPSPLLAAGRGGRQDGSAAAEAEAAVAAAAATAAEVAAAAAAAAAPEVAAAAAAAAAAVAAAAGGGGGGVVAADTARRSKAWRSGAAERDAQGGSASEGSASTDAAAAAAAAAAVVGAVVPVALATGAGATTGADAELCAGSDAAAAAGAGGDAARGPGVQVPRPPSPPSPPSPANTSALCASVSGMLGSDSDSDSDDDDDDDHDDDDDDGDNAGGFGASGDAAGSGDGEEEGDFGAAALMGGGLVAQAAVLEQEAQAAAAAVVVQAAARRRAGARTAGQRREAAAAAQAEEAIAELGRRRAAAALRLQLCCRARLARAARAALAAPALLRKQAAMAAKAAKAAGARARTAEVNRALINQVAVIEHAIYLGVDPDTEPELLGLAEEALLAPVPPPWEAVADGARDGAVFFFNGATGASEWTHPMDAHYRRLIALQRELERGVGGGSGEGGGGEGGGGGEAGEGGVEGAEGTAAVAPLPAGDGRAERRLSTSERLQSWLEQRLTPGMGELEIDLESAFAGRTPAPPGAAAAAPPAPPPPQPTLRSAPGMLDRLLDKLLPSESDFEVRRAASAQLRPPHPTAPLH